VNLKMKLSQDFPILKQLSSNIIPSFHVERFKLTDEQMETFGDAFGKVYKTDIDYPEKIQIITLQTLLYDRCGASEKFEAVRVQSEKLQEEINNQPIQSIEN